MVKDRTSPLPDAVDETPMQKYAVHETGDSTKIASRRITHCPVCNSLLEAHGEVLLCPEHGSKPFEG